PPGGSLTLLCRASGFDFGPNSRIFWVRQRTGRTEMEVLGGGGKFRISGGDGRGSAALTADGLGHEDSGVYFCAAHGDAGHGDGRRETSGWGGSRLARPSAPSVFPLVTCGLGSAPSRPIGCLASGFIPAPVAISWSPAPPSSPAPIPQVRAASGTFRAGSRFLLQGASASGSGRSFRCQVRHEVFSPEFSLFLSEFFLLFLPEFSPFLLKSFRFFPPNFHFFSPNFLPSFALFSPQILTQIFPNFRFFSSNFFFSFFSFPAPGSSPISVFILPPSPSDLYITQTPKISCLVTSLPSDQDLSITWSRPSGGGALREPLPLKLTNQYNGTFTALSQLPVTTADWEGGASFACRVGHADLPAPVERTMEKRQGKSLPPSVYLIPPPADELSGPRPTLSLTCLVRGFFPENIDVQWQKNHESLGFAQNAENFGASTAPARREKGGAGSFFLYSRLEVEREEWEKGTTFVCTVVHEGLPLRFVQRSLHRNPGN
uniref:Ig-like domain-containing protein n=1 Tax=Cyanoderma ruficeps TaxID=181631 RepID=A0A8C3R2M6_9PASS